MAHLELSKVHLGLSHQLYRGVAIQKFPLDYVMYQMIIHEVRPDLIIEIGTMHGGSALYFADLLELFEIEGGKVHSIDWIDPTERKQRELEMDHKPNPKENPNYPDVVAEHPRIKTFSGGYQAYDLANCEGFKRILVIDDGSHIYQEVLEAMEKFKKLVALGSYLIIEDGNARDVCDKPEVLAQIEGGPLMAIHTFLATNDEFRIDFRWCDMYGINATYNTYGFLKKIKKYEG